MKVNLNFSADIDLAKAFAAIEAGRKSVRVVLKTHYSATKRDIGLMFRESVWPLLQEIHNPKLTAQCARIEATVYGPDDTFDMGSFWIKADYLRGIVHELLSLNHSDLTILYKRDRRSTRIEVEFSWREVLWAEDTEGLRF